MSDGVEQHVVGLEVAMPEPTPIRGRPRGSLELRGRATRATWTEVRRSAAWRALCLDFGERLRTLRRERGIAASEFAAAVDVSTSAVMSWERGRMPAVAVLMACSIALGCTLADLLPERAHRR